MKIEYDWEDWQPPTRAKLIRRRIIGTIGLVLVGFIVVCLSLVLLTGIAGIAFSLTGSNGVAGWGLILVFALGAGVLCWITELHWMLGSVLHSIWLWSKCKMRVGVL